MSIYHKLSIDCFGYDTPILIRIKEWDLEQAINTAKQTEDAYRFCFNTFNIVEEKQNGMYTVKVKLIKQSGFYYLNGYIETTEDVAAKVKLKESSNKLLKQMEDNGWKKIIRGTKHNWIKPFLIDDVLVDKFKC